MLNGLQIICSRGNVELSHKIEAMMRERFYVPVIRSVDNSMPPIIGEPFSTSNPPVRTYLSCNCCTFNLPN